MTGLIIGNILAWLMFAVLLVATIDTFRKRPKNHRCEKFQFYSIVCIDCGRYTGLAHPPLTEKEIIRGREIAAKFGLAPDFPSEHGSNDASSGVNESASTTETV